MRIGIDGRELLGQRTGVGRYLAELLTEWATSADDHHEFVIYTPGDASSLTIAGREVAAISHFRQRPVPVRSGIWWEQLDLAAVAQGDSLDVFFAPAYSAPLRLRIPCVVTMHDVSFMAHPEWFRWREGLRRRVLAAQTMSRARAVITVSHFSRREILRFCHVPSDRVHVVHSGVRGRAPATEHRSSNPHVLYTGSIFNRRHVPTLIAAFRKVCRIVPDARLELVGDDRTYPAIDLPSLIAQAGVASRVSLHAYVSDNDLGMLFQRARVFAFLSEYEGFGFTPLEAMSAGVPVVVADTPVARELYDDAAAFVPIRDVPATTRAIARLLVDPVAHARQRDRGAARAASLSWKRAAEKTLGVFERVVRNNG